MTLCAMKFNAYRRESQQYRQKGNAMEKGRNCKLHVDAADRIAQEVIEGRIVKPQIVLMSQVIFMADVMEERQRRAFEEHKSRICRMIPKTT
jgi:hypothetical protein